MDANMCSWTMMPGVFRTAVATRSAVEALIADGLTQSEIAVRLGRTKSTIAYHMRGLGIPIDERCNRRYDWSQIQMYYDEGHTVAECKGPNCHSQTENFAGRNRRRAPA
jgi:hypothetical protein